MAHEEDNSEASTTGIGRKPTKQKILKDLKADMNAADTLRLEMVAKIECWRKEYKGEPYGNEQKGKSEIVSRDIKRQDEWQHASIKDPFVADPDIVKAGPVTAEDRPLAEQNELVLNNQFCRHFPRYRFMSDVIKLHYSEGTVVTKCSWNYEDETIEEEVPIYGQDLLGNVTQVGTKTIKRLKVKVNKPHAQVCRIEDIYMDPTSEGDMDKAQFVIHRYESDLSTLRKPKSIETLISWLRRSVIEKGMINLTTKKRTRLNSSLSTSLERSSWSMSTGATTTSMVTE
jgi:hypothetical protein